MKNNNIALLIPYFGSFPDYFPFYLHSLQYNPELHVYILSDSYYAGELPSNCTIIEYSLDKFKLAVKEKLAISCEFNEPIKMCDYRPAYGLLFQEYISGYEYWAFGDLDVIYGDIINMLPDNWDSYDVISMLDKWVSGSLFILRNDKRINEIFKKSSAWENVYSSSVHYAFDECNHLYDRIKLGEDILKIDENQSFSYLLKTEMLKGGIKAWFKYSIIKERIYFDDYVLFNRGTVSQKDGNKVAYFHMINQKRDPAFKIPLWDNIPEKYYIDRYGIATERQHKSINYKVTSRIKGNIFRIIYYLKKIFKAPNWMFHLLKQFLRQRI